MDEKQVRMLRPPEVCAWLGISQDTLNKWFGMGLVGYKVEKVILIPENKLWEFLAEHQATGGKPGE